MGRIPETELQRLQREVSLVDLVRGAGVELKRHGADWIGLCPFHPDTNPSLVITPAKNLWHCLGACQAGGSVIDWVMRREGLSFRHAVAQLQKALPGGGPARSGLDPGLDDAALLRAVIGYYHATLLASPAAIAYLEKRGLNHRAAIERFQLGYANRTLTYQLPDGKPGRVLRERLERLGILRASGHEHLNGGRPPRCARTGPVPSLALGAHNGPIMRTGPRPPSRSRRSVNITGRYVNWGRGPLLASAPARSEKTRG